MLVSGFLSFFCSLATCPEWSQVQWAEPHTTIIHQDSAPTGMLTSYLMEAIPQGKFPFPSCVQLTIKANYYSQLPKTTKQVFILEVGSAVHRSWISHLVLPSWKLMTGLNRYLVKWNEANPRVQCGHYPCGLALCPCLSTVLKHVTASSITHGWACEKSANTFLCYMLSNIEKSLVYDLAPHSCFGT